MSDERIRKVMELQQTLASLGKANADAAAIQRAIITLEHRRDRLRSEIHILSIKEEP